MRRHLLSLCTVVLLVVVLLWTLFPLSWMVMTALKHRIEAFRLPPTWRFHPTLDNFRIVFVRDNYLHFVKNSLIVGVGSTLLAIGTGVLGAYGLVRISSRASKNVALWILSTRIAPPALVVIPIYVLWQSLHLYDTLLGLILVHAGMNLPFVIWLLMGFVEKIPPDFEEAAQLDGCSVFGAFVRVVLPLLAPGLSAVGILTFLFSWNEFLFALVLTGYSTRTLPISATMFVGERGVEWGPMCAAGVIIVAPALIAAMIGHRYLIKGLSYGTLD